MKQWRFYRFILWFTIGQCGLALAAPEKWQLGQWPNQDAPHRDAPPQDPITRNLRLEEYSLETFLKELEQNPHAYENFHLNLQAVRLIIRSHRTQILLNSSDLHAQRRVIDKIEIMKAHWNEEEKGWLEYLEALLVSDQCLLMKNPEAVHRAEGLWKSAVMRLKVNAHDLNAILEERARFRLAAYEKTVESALLETGLQDLKQVIESFGSFSPPQFDIRFLHAKGLYHWISLQKTNWPLAQSKQFLERAIAMTADLVPLTPLDIPEGERPADLLSDLRTLLTEIEFLKNSNLPPAAGHPPITTPPLLEASNEDQVRTTRVPNDISEIQDVYTFVAPRQGTFAELAKEDAFLRILPLWTKEDDLQWNEQVTESWMDIKRRNPNRQDWISPLHEGDIVYVPLSIRIHASFRNQNHPLESNAANLNDEELILIYRRAIVKRIDRLRKLPETIETRTKIDLLSLVLNRENPALTLQELVKLYPLSIEDSPEALREISAILMPVEAQDYLPKIKMLLINLEFALDLFESANKLTPFIVDYWQKYLLAEKSLNLLSVFPDQIFPRTSVAKKRFYLWIIFLIKERIKDESKRSDLPRSRLEELWQICQDGDLLFHQNQKSIEIFQRLYAWLTNQELFDVMSVVSDTELLNFIRIDHHRFQRVFLEAYQKQLMTQEQWEGWRVRIEKARVDLVELLTTLTPAETLLANMARDLAKSLDIVRLIRPIREMLETISKEKRISRTIRQSLLRLLSPFQILLKILESNLDTFLSFKTEFPDLMDALENEAKKLEPNRYRQWERLKLLAKIGTSDLDELSSQMDDPERARLFRELAERIKNKDLSGESNERLGLLAEALATGGAEALLKLIEWIGPENLTDMIASMDPETLVWFAQVFSKLFDNTEFDLDLSRFGVVLESLARRLFESGIDFSALRNVDWERLSRAFQRFRAPDWRLNFPRIPGPNINFRLPDFHLPSLRGWRFWDGWFDSREVELNPVDYDFSDMWPYNEDILLEIKRCKENDFKLGGLSKDDPERNVEAPYLTRAGESLFSLPKVGSVTDMDDAILEKALDPNNYNFFTATPDDTGIPRLSSPALEWLSHTRELLSKDASDVSRNKEPKLTHSAAQRLVMMSYQIANRYFDELYERAHEYHPPLLTRALSEFSLDEIRELFVRIVPIAHDGDLYEKYRVSSLNWRLLGIKFQTTWVAWLEKYQQYWKYPPLDLENLRLRNYFSGLQKISDFWKYLCIKEVSPYAFPGLTQHELHPSLSKDPWTSVLNAIAKQPFHKNSPRLWDVTQYTDFLDKLARNSTPEDLPENYDNMVGTILDLHYDLIVNDIQDQLANGLIGEKLNFIKNYITNFLDKESVLKTIQKNPALPSVEKAQRNFLKILELWETLRDHRWVSYFLFPNALSRQLIPLSSISSSMRNIQLIAERLRLSQNDMEKLQCMFIADILKYQALLIQWGFKRYALGHLVFSAIEHLTNLSNEQIQAFFADTIMPPQSWMNRIDYLLQRTKDKKYIQKFIADKIKTWNRDELSASVFGNNDESQNYLKSHYPKLFSLREGYKTGAITDFQFDLQTAEKKELDAFLSTTRDLNDQMRLAIALLPSEDFWKEFIEARERDSNPENHGLVRAKLWLEKLFWLVFTDAFPAGRYDRETLRQKGGRNREFFQALLKYGLNLDRALQLNISTWECVADFQERFPEKSEPLEGILNIEMPEGIHFYPNRNEGDRPLISEFNAKERRFSEVMGEGKVPWKFLSPTEIGLLEIGQSIEASHAFDALMKRSQDLEDQDLWFYHTLRALNRAIEIAKARGFGWVSGEGYLALNPRIKNTRTSFFQNVPAELLPPEAKTDTSSGNVTELVSETIRYRMNDLSQDSLLLGAASIKMEGIFHTEKILTEWTRTMDEEANLDEIYARVKDTDPNRTHIHKELLDYELERFYREAMDLSTAQDAQKNNLSSVEKRWRLWMKKARAHQESALFWQKSLELYQTIKNFVRQSADSRSGMLLGEWFWELYQMKLLSDTVVNTTVAQFERDLLGRDPRVGDPRVSDPNVAIGFFHSLWSKIPHLPLEWAEFKNSFCRENPELAEIIRILPSRLDTERSSHQDLKPQEWFALLENGRPLDKWNWAKEALRGEPQREILNKIVLLLNHRSFVNGGPLPSEVTRRELIEVAQKMAQWIIALQESHDNMDSFVGTLPDLIKNFLWEAKIRANPLNEFQDHVYNNRPSRFGILRSALFFPNIESWLQWVKTFDRQTSDWFLETVSPPEWSLRQGYEMLRPGAGELPAENIFAAVLGLMWRLESPAFHEGRTTAIASLFGSAGAIDKALLAGRPTSLLSGDAAWVQFAEDTTLLREKFEKMNVEREPEISFNLERVLDDLERWARSF